VVEDEVINKNATEWITRASNVMKKAGEIPVEALL